MLSFVGRGWESSWICHPASPHDLVQSWDMLLQPTTSMRKENIWLQRFLFLYMWWSTTPFVIMASVQGSVGIPVHASQGSVHPWHTLNAIAISHDCTSVAWCGSEQAAPGDANTWVTASLQHWPPTSIFQLNWCRSPLVSLTSACCVPRFYYNIRTQWPVALETVHDWFLPCVACPCANRIWKADRHIRGILKMPSIPLCVPVNAQCE